MFSLDTAVARLPLVLVVDPVAASRLLIWRLLSRSFGVVEAADAQGARDWLASRPDIGALVVQAELAQADGSEFLKSLSTVSIASRILIVGKPVDVRQVATILAGWFFTRDTGKTLALLRAADRSVS